jgi:hypothetical protein
MFNQIFVEYLSSLWISFKGQTHYVMNCLFFILHALRAAPISPIKLNLALQKRGTTNNKPLGWIIVIGQSDTGSSSIITFIRMNTGSRGHFSRLCCAFYQAHHPVENCWAKTASFDFCSSNFNLLGHKLNTVRAGDFWVVSIRIPSICPIYRYMNQLKRPACGGFWYATV